MTQAPSIDKPTVTPEERAERRAERAYWLSALAELCSSRYRLTLDPMQDDDAATPSADLVGLIQDPLKADPDVFLATGARDTLCFLRALHDYGWDPLSFRRILDMGCGLSRITRHWLLFPECEVHGCDVTPPVVEYSRGTLGDRVAYEVTRRTPPLPYASASFDFLFANSVFTHIQSPLVFDWVREVARVLRPGGAAIISAFDPHVQMWGHSPRDFDRLVMGGGGVYEWGDETVRQSYRYGTERADTKLWGAEFEVLEIRQIFKAGRHLILRRR